MLARGYSASRLSISLLCTAIKDSPLSQNVRIPLTIRGRVGEVRFNGANTEIILAEISTNVLINDDMKLSLCAISLSNRQFTR